MKHRNRWLAMAVVPAVAAGLTLSGCSAAGSSAAKEEKETTLFDETALHTIEVDVDPDELEEMVSTYLETDEKEWIKGDVTIDGREFTDVGLRLKGNSSLRGLTEETDPSEMPWLLRLDEFVEGQELDGTTELVVRPNGSETSLNEAVALDLLEEAGLATQQSMATSFSVNGEDPRLRLVIENLDEHWEKKNFDSDGALYKAEAEGDWSYRGDDPESYEDVFDQETGDEDMTPLIEFLDFVNNASDEEFAEKLPEWLDVESFATYLAFQEAIDNFDDIDGPGNNAFLRWDAEKEQFTVVAWDHNLAFGARPEGPGGLGGPGGKPGDGRGGERPALPEGLDEGDLPEMPEPEDLPDLEDLKNLEDLDELRELLKGMPGGPHGPAPHSHDQDRDGDRDEDRDRDQDQDQPAMPSLPGLPGTSSNPLVERFTEVPEFQELLTEAREKIQTELFDSGLAEDVLQRWVDLLAEDAGDLVDEEALNAEADEVRSSIEGDRGPGFPGGHDRDGSRDDEDRDEPGEHPSESPDTREA